MEGFLAFKQDQYERAIEWLRQAVRANPDDANTRLLLGLALFRTGKHAQAREELMAGLRRTVRPGSDIERHGRETLAVIEEAQGSSTDVLTTSRSAVDVSKYHNLAVSMIARPVPDYAEAAKWFRKATELGDPGSQLALGMLCWTGRGVPKDPVQAVHWWRNSAEGGNPTAMRLLGMAHGLGVGVERSIEEALRWIRRAAEGGDAEAQATLGKACYEGKVVPKNPVEALCWLTLAVEAEAKTAKDDGVEFADRELVSALRQARHLLKEVELFATPEEKAQARAMVEKFKASRAAQGDLPRPRLPLRNSRGSCVPAPR